MIQIYDEFIHVNLINFAIIARTSVCFPIQLALSIITPSMVCNIIECKYFPIIHSAVSVHITPPPY